MCLITEQKEPFIADEDIVIWKSVHINNDIIYPLYRASSKFTYKLGKLHETEMVANNIGADFFDHNVCRKYNLFGSVSEIQIKMSELTNVHEGFHACLFCDRDDNINIKGIIPKEALYYKDATGLVVSNKIILQEIL